MLILDGILVVLDWGLKLAQLLFLLALLPVNCVCYLSGHAFAGMKNSFQKGMRDYKNGY